MAEKGVGPWLGEVGVASQGVLRATLHYTRPNNTLVDTVFRAQCHWNSSDDREWTQEITLRRTDDLAWEAECLWARNFSLDLPPDLTIALTASSGSSWTTPPRSLILPSPHAPPSGLNLLPPLLRQEEEKGCDRSRTSVDASCTRSLISGTLVVFEAQLDRGATPIRWTRTLDGVDQRVLDHGSLHYREELWFSDPGPRNLTVRAENVYGEVSHSRHLMIVDRLMENVSLSLTPGSPGLLTPGGNVTFLLTLAAVRFQDLQIHLDFGDGSNLTTGFPESTWNELVVRRCRTQLTLTHRYDQEGTFTPSAYVTDTGDHVNTDVRDPCVRSNVTGKPFRSEPVFLPSPVRVTTVLLGVKIYGPRILAVGQKGTFIRQMHSNAQHLLRWTLLHLNRTMDLRHRTSTYEHVFTDPGDYTLEVDVSNPLTLASSFHRILVQERITDLRLSPEGSIASGKMLGIAAEYRTGSNVSCDWTVGTVDCLLEHVEGNCLANLTCFVPGNHSVRVQARNHISQAETDLVLQVLDPVADLELFANASDEVTEVTASVLTGTDVTLTLVFAKGSAVERGKSSLTLRRLLPAGSQISAVASNAISRMEKKIKVRTLPASPPSLRLKSFGCEKSGARKNFVVLMPNGSLPVLPEAVYRWATGNGTSTSRQYTAVPFVDLLHTNKTPRLTVIYKGGRLKVRPSDLDDAEGPCLLHPVFLATSQVVSFQKQNDDLSERGLPSPLLLQGQPTSDQNCTSRDNESITLAPLPDGTFSWRALLPGVYRVGPWREGGDPSWLLVQAPLPKLQLQGPRRLRIGRLPVSGHWKVQGQEGVNGSLGLNLECNPGLIFEWTLQAEAIETEHHTTACPLFSPLLPQAGFYSLKVKVHSPSWNTTATTQLTIRVRSAIRDLQVAATPTGPSLANFTVQVRGSPEIQVWAEFGDGCSKALSRQRKEVRYSQLATDHHRFVFSHTYAPALTPNGQRVAHFNVSNTVSWRARSTLVDLKRRSLLDGKVVCFLESPSTVALLETVTVTAVVDGSPDDLCFLWNFGDMSYGAYTNATRTLNGSRAIHNYSIAGRFFVQIKVWRSAAAASALLTEQHCLSMLPGAESWLFNLSDRIHVVEPVERLDFSVSKNILMLERTSDGFWATEKVVLEAKLHKGSDVELEFDFGDGTLKNHNINMYDMSFTPFYTRHAYRAEGVYRVSVRASNVLGSLRRIFHREVHVQFSPSGLRLSNDTLVAKTDQQVSLWAHLVQGTDVSFNWYIKKEVLALGIGPAINVTFTKSGDYEVIVEAQNLATDFAKPSVNRPKQACTVTVQEIIKGVVICTKAWLSDSKVCLEPGGEPLEVVWPLEESVQLSARVTPPDSLTGARFIWNTSDGEPKRTIEPRLTHKFLQAGRYLVSVRMENNLSWVASASALQLHLVKRVEDLTLRRQPEDVLTSGKAAHFMALVKHGSDLTFQWDFGDGTPLRLGKDSVNHTYNRSGEFRVTVLAWNAISSTNVSMGVFVVEGPGCSIRLLSFVDQCYQQVVSYSSPVYLETEVNISCAEGTALKEPRAFFQWTITGRRNLLAASEIPDQWLTRRDVALTPRMLPIDIYDVRLKVNLTGTIVYAVVNTTLQIVSDAPAARIRGGIQRTLGREDTLELDGSVSNIPTHAGDTRLFWQCSDLRSKQLLCFPDPLATPRAMSSSDVYAFPVPGSWANPAFDALVFNLTVSFGNSHSSTSQVLELTEGSALLLETNCVNCKNQNANSHQPLVLQAGCANCGDKEMTYHWTLWLIQDGAHDLHDATPYECIQANGSISYLSSKTESRRKAKDLSVQRSNQSSEAILQDGRKQRNPSKKQGSRRRTISGFSLPKNNGTASRSRRESGQTSRSPGGSKPNHLDKPHGKLFGSPVEGNSEYLNVSHNGPFQNVFDQEEIETGRQPPHPVEEAQEGLPGEVGSANARDYNTLKLPQSKGYHPDNDIEEGQANGRDGFGSGDKDSFGQKGSRLPVDPLRAHRPTSSTPHLVSRPRELLTWQGKAQFKGPHLVISPGLLLSGRSYLLEVDATHPDMKLSGRALEYVHIRRGPSNGRCTVQPNQGLPLTTQFILHCLEWQSDHKPLHYCLRYSLSRSGPQWLIYRGLNRNIRFPLPNGLTQYNHSVYLHISVVDSLGATTDVCIVETKVAPVLRAEVAATPSSVLQQELLGSSSSGNDILPKLIGEQNTRSYLHRVHVLATLLNKSTENSQVKRTAVQQLLAVVKKAVFLEQSQAFQAIATLEAISYSVVEQEDLNEIIPIFELAFRQAFYLDDQMLVSRNEWFVYSLANQLLFRIVDNNHYFDEWKDKYVTKLRVIVQNVLQLKMKMSLPTENMTSFHFANMSGFACKIEKDPLTIDFLDVSVVIHAHQPSRFNLENRVASVIGEYFKRNVISINSDSSNIKSMISLTMQDAVDQSTSLDISLQVSTENEYGDVFDLEAGNLNVHYLNLSTGNQNSSLFIIAEFLTAEEEEDDVDDDQKGFNVELMFGIDEQLLPSFQSIRKPLEHGQSSVEIFIPSGYIKDHNTPHVSLVDASYIPTEQSAAKIRRYRLYVRGQGCLYVTANQWKDDVCQVTSQTNRGRVTCSCSRLGTVGFSLWSPAFSFATFPLDSLLLYKPHPIALALLTTYLTLYLLLLFLYCCPADSLNARKPSVVQLPENEPGESHHYLVTIRTGCFWDAGTTAAVFVTLHGTNGLSRVKQMTCAGAFQRTATDHFLFSTKSSLGQLLKVQVWHNNTGSSPSWYLKDIVVTDMQTGQNSVFDCEQLLSVDEEDGLLEKEFLLKDFEPSWITVFSKSLSSTLPDYHIWSSVLCGPCPGAKGCGLSRVQRLSLCLITLLAGAALTAWITAKIQVLDLKNLCLGIPWQSCIWGSLSATAVYVFHLCVTFVLRRLPCAPTLCSFGHLPSTIHPCSDCGWQTALSWTCCGSRVKRTSRDDCAESAPSMMGDSDYGGASDQNDGSGDEAGENDFLELKPMKRSVECVNLENSLSQWQYIESWAKRKSLQCLHRFSLTQTDASDWFPSKQFNDGVSLHSRSSRSSQISYNQVTNDPDDPIQTSVVKGRKSIRRLFSCLFWPVLMAMVAGLSFLTITLTLRFSSDQCVFWLQTIFFAFFVDFVFLQSSQVVLMAVLQSRRILSRGSWAAAIGHGPFRRAQRLIETLGDKEHSTPLEDSNCHKMDSYYLKPPESRLKKERVLALKARRTSLFFKKIFFTFLLTFHVASMMYLGYSSSYFRQTAAVKNMLMRSGLASKCQVRQFLEWAVTSFPSMVYEDPVGPIYSAGSLLVGKPELHMLSMENSTNANVTLEGRNLIANRTLNDIVSRNENQSSQMDVTLSFLLYSPSMNIFTPVFVSGEFWGSKPSKTVLSISPCVLLKLPTDGTYLYPLLEIGFVITILYISKTELWNALKHGRKYWKNFTNCSLVVFCVLGFIRVLVLLLYSALAQISARQFRQTRTISVLSMKTLANCEYSIQALVGFLVFLLAFQWLSVLQFLSPFQIVIRTMAKVHKETFAILALLLVLVVGHGLLTSLCLIPNDLWRNLLRSLLLLLREAPRDAWEDNPHDVSRLSIYCFTLIVMLLFSLAMLKASMNHSRKRRSASPPKIALSVKGTKCFLRKKLTLTPAPSRTPTDLAYPALEFLLHELETAVEEMEDRASRLFPEHLLDNSDLEENLDDPVPPTTLLEPYLGSSSNSLGSLQPDLSDDIMLTEPDGFLSQPDEPFPSQIQASPRSTLIRQAASRLQCSPAFRVRKTRALLDSMSLLQSPILNSRPSVFIRRTKSKGKGKGLELEGLVDPYEHQGLHQTKNRGSETDLSQEMSGFKKT